MKLNNKNINLLKVAAMVILIVGIFCLNLTKYGFGGMLVPCAIGCLLIEGAFRSLKAKYDPEGLEQEDEEKKKFEAESQKVKVPFTLVGGLCDAVTVIVLIVTWSLVFNRHLLETGDKRFIGVIVASTLFSLLYLGITYYPKVIGGPIGVLGRKQVKQLIIRDHALALTAALFVLTYILLIDTEFGWLPLALLVAVIVLYLSKMFIKTARAAKFFQKYGKKY